MNKGVLITFSGIDGAGKSTQVKILSEYLTSQGKKVLTTESMFGYFLLKPLVKMLRPVTGSLPRGPVNRNKSGVLKLWFIFAFVDIWLGFIFKIRPKLKIYDYIIADRFYADILANLLYYGYIPDWAFTVFVRLLPKPDMAFMFSVEPETVLKREREFPSEYYYEQAKIYKRLSKDIGMNIIDASKESSRVFEQLRSYL